MKRFLQYLPFLLVFCVTALLFIKVNQNGKDAADGFLAGSQMIGKEVPDQELDVISPAGGKLNAASFKGEGFKVINLFASWCVACAYEHKYIKELQGTSGLKVIGIAWRDKKDDALGWLEKNGNPYDSIGLDSLGKFGILLGVTGIPETFLIDPNGRIVMHLPRTVTPDDIEKMKEEIGKNKTN